MPDSVCKTHISMMKINRSKYSIYIVLLVAVFTTGFIGNSFVLGEEGDEGGQQIDIQAEEQEFNDDQVIARGKVRVDYGDTIISGPKAIMFRNEGGAASKAIFTGKPHLTQGKNKIRANKLTFMVKEKSILAEGAAHSEIYTDDEPQSESSNDNSPAKPKPKPKASGNPGGDKIITDSNKQEYERASGKFEAHGNVRVRTGDIKVRADHMRIVYGNNGKAESAIFTGHAEAQQEKNITQADRITYFLATQRLQATGHVRSKVIEETSDASNTADSEGTKISKASTKDDGKVKFVSFGNTDTIDAPVYIFSDSQDYNKETNRMDAVGNVKLIYKDTRGKGPRIILLKNKYGKAEKVIFVGRSRIAQPGKRWIGDRITLTLHDRKVLAEGNTRAIIVKEDSTKNTNQKPRGNPAPDFNNMTNQNHSRLANTNSNPVR